MTPPLPKCAEYSRKRATRKLRQQPTGLITTRTLEVQGITAEKQYDDSTSKIKTTRKAIGKKTRFEVFKRDAFTCQYCGAKAPDVILHVDHIDPVANGGGNDIMNLVTACEGCNLGKGARTISDDSEIARQRAQLDDLNARREQLEGMLRWREGLRDIDAQELDAACELWDVQACPNTLTDTGIAELKKLARKFGYPTLIQAIDKAVGNYVRHDEEGATLESVNLAFSKLGGICYFLQNPDKSDSDKDIYYVRGILRNRLGYVNQSMCVKLLRDAVSADVNMDSVKDFAKTVKNWTDFRSVIEEYIRENGNG